MSRTHLVTFSDESMSRSRELCVLSARHHGVGEVHEYEPSGVASGFIGHEAIWNNPKGCGLWAWKPMIISATMWRANIGDTFIYADAGVEFINDVSHIIERMDQDIFLFGNNWEHAHWCKRDIVEAVWPLPIDRQSFIDAGVQMSTPSNLVAVDVDGIENLYSWARFGKQCQASVIFFRVSDYSRKFVAEWLKWCLHRLRFSEGVCTDEWRYLIDDSPSIKPNHPEFRENRHDQSILTTLAYREGLRLHWWGSVYNRFVGPEFIYEKLPCYAEDSYPPIFHHHRLRNAEFDAIRLSIESATAV